MASNNLTSTTAAAAKPQAKRYWLWAKDLKGFGLSVQPSGSKSYYYTCRVNGAQKFQRIADHGEIEFAAARDLATKLAALAVDARNLSREYTPETVVKPTAPERAPLTVEGMFAFYFEQHGRTTKRPAQLRGIWTRHCQPLASKLVTDLDVERVQAWHDDIEAPIAALHAVQLLRAAARLCMKRPSKSGWPQGWANPFSGVEVKKARPRKRKLEGADLTQFAVAATQHPDSAIRAFLLALHVTGARISELRLATVQQYDPARRCIVWEDSKNDDQRVLTLGPVTGQLVEQVIGKRKSGLIWTGDCKDGGFDFRKGWAATCALAGVSKYTFHDARRSFSAALAAEGNFSDFTIEELLGHRLPGVQKHYRSLDTHSPVRAKAAAVVEATMGLTKPASRTQKLAARRAV